MRRRYTLVEHQFGTFKRWAGINHFLMRSFDKCRSGFSLVTLSYNFKRVMNVLGGVLFTEFVYKDGGLGRLACDIALEAPFCDENISSFRAIYPFTGSPILGGWLIRFRQ